MHEGAENTDSVTTHERERLSWEWDLIHDSKDVKDIRSHLERLYSQGVGVTEDPKWPGFYYVRKELALDEQRAVLRGYLSDAKIDWFTISFPNEMKKPPLFRRNPQQLIKESIVIFFKGDAEGDYYTGYSDGSIYDYDGQLYYNRDLNEETPLRGRLEEILRATALAIE